MLTVGVVCGILAVAQAAGDFEKERQARLDRIGPYIYNTDGCEMYYYPSNCPVSAAAFKSLRLDYAKGTKVRTVSYCPLSSGFGFFSVPGVGEYNTRPSPPLTVDIHHVYPKGAKNVSHYNAASAFERQLGTDAVQMSIDWCRENGCQAFVSLRFNDTHDRAPSDQAFLFPSFKENHPDCLVGSKDKPPRVGAWSAVDFSRPVVREYFRKFVREFFEKYDMDGFEIDFFRHALVFKSVADGGEATPEELSLLTELVAYVRETAEVFGRRRGHPILIAVRTPDSVGYCKAIGFDVEAWLSRKLVDIWTVAGYFQFEQWSTSVALAKRHGVRCYASIDESRINLHARRNGLPTIYGRETMDNYAARFASAFAGGCDGVNLFNQEYQRLVDLTKDGPEALACRNKIYFATERGTGGYPPTEYLLNPWGFDRMPRLDPGRPLSLAADGSYSFEMLLGEDFAAAAKLGRRPKVTLIALPDENVPVEVTVNGHTVTTFVAEQRIHKFSVEPTWIKKGLNSFSVRTKAANHLHDFAVKVIYEKTTLAAQRCVKDVSYSKQSEVCVGDRAAGNTCELFAYPTNVVGGLSRHCIRRPASDPHRLIEQIENRIASFVCSEESNSRPENPLLVLHLDFNTIQMKCEAVVDCLRTAARMGYNAVLWEVENKVRWECCPECVHPEAFSKDEFREILKESFRLGLAPIPLMQTFGHAEYILMGGKHPGWIEDADFPACYCVSNPEVRAFQKRLLHEYLELFGPEVKDFHLGGDEAIVFGTCPKCRTKDKFGLYASHLSFVAEELRERRIRPGIWCDRMLNQTNRADMAKIPRDFTLWNWNYAFGTDGAKPGREAKVGLLKEMGYEMIFGCTSQSVMDSTFLPLYGRHRQNITASADLVRKEALRGLCMTSWSVHLFPKALQYPLWDFAARRLLNPSADPLDDYMAAVRCGFGDVSAETLDRLSQWSMDFMQFDSRITKGYLKPAQPAKPGRLDEILSHLKDPGSRAEFIRTLDNVHAEVRAGRNELDAVAVAKPEMALLKSAADRVLCNLGSIRAIVEGWPVRDDRDESIRFYASEQTPLSARNSSALVWSIMVQSALFGKGK